MVFSPKNINKNAERENAVHNKVYKISTVNCYLKIRNRKKRKRKIGTERSRKKKKIKKWP